MVQRRFPLLWFENMNLREQSRVLSGTIQTRNETTVLAMSEYQPFPQWIEFRYLTSLFSTNYSESFDFEYRHPKDKTPSLDLFRPYYFADTVSTHRAGVTETRLLYWRPDVIWR